MYVFCIRVAGQLHSLAAAAPPVAAADAEQRKCCACEVENGTGNSNRALGMLSMLTFIRCGSDAS